jgi:hypothetical protein
MRGGENSLDKKVRKEMGLSWPLYHILLEVREEIEGQLLARQVINGYEVSPLGDEGEMGLGREK